MHLSCDDIDGRQCTPTAHLWQLVLSGELARLQCVYCAHAVAAPAARRLVVRDRTAAATRVNAHQCRGSCSTPLQQWPGRAKYWSYCVASTSGHRSCRGHVSLPVPRKLVPGMSAATVAAVESVSVMRPVQCTPSCGPPFPHTPSSCMAAALGPRLAHLDVKTAPNPPANATTPITMRAMIPPPRPPRSHQAYGQQDIHCTRLCELMCCQQKRAIDVKCRVEFKNEFLCPATQPDTVAGQAALAPDTQLNQNHTHTAKQHGGRV